LEERLQFALFIRETRKVTLTPRGQQLSRAATDAFGILDREFSAVSASAEGMLTITTTPTFSAYWLAPRLGAFQAAQPELAVRVDASMQVADLVRGDFDVALRWGDGHWPGLESHFLFEDAVAPLVTAQAAARFGPFNQPRDLLRLRLVS